MRKFLVSAAAALVALSLGGCSDTLTKIETTVSNAVGVIGGAKINSKSAYVAINVFDAAERSVTAYLKLPACNGSIPLCRVHGAAQALDQPFNAGITARDSLRSFMKANPGTLADAGLYSTLTAATNSLEKVMAIYGIGTGGSK